jgi:hypothetical protein
VTAAGPTAALTYAFGTLGWDCVLTGVVLTPDKSLLHDFFMPTQTYSARVGLTQLRPGLR